MRFKSLSVEFSQPLLAWFDYFGRKDLPWQNPRTPYRVWVSEVMLQQTQVKTVIPYFNQFIHRFPDIWQLASAPEDEVLSYWSGLGYYSRARHLIKTAKIICTQYQGQFPHDLQALISLPGIGESTAAAISSQAFNLPTPILDGNVKRVLCRYFMVEGAPELSSVKKHLWQLAKACMPQKRCADYTQAIMDLGATCCTTRKPACHICPVSLNCRARQEEKVATYPFKKIKKNLPVQEKQFLLLYTKTKQIYLEKRPPVGLWGGLWCMPIINRDNCPQTYLQENYQLRPLHTHTLMSIKHSFSHFHLRITVLAMLIEPFEQMLQESFGQWMASKGAFQLGLAKPIMTILKHFQDNFPFESEGH
jgi:A/G-specific adenine glycosylase